MPLILILTIALSSLAGPAYAASFDCQQARLSVEKKICASDSLSLLDEELAAVFKQRRSHADSEAITQSQRAWLKRRNSCLDDKCIAQSYNDQLWHLAASRTGGLAENPASVKCDVKRMSLTLVEGAESTILRLEGTKQVDLAALLTYEENSQTGNAVGRASHVESRCKLGSAEYNVSVYPWMMTYNPMGGCGVGHPSLGLVIIRNGVSLLPKGFGFSNNCHNEGSIKYMVFSERTGSVSVGYFKKEYEADADSPRLLRKSVSIEKLRSVLDDVERKSFLLK